MSDGRRLRVAHVITRLIVGGAQETVMLAAALADQSRFDPLIVTGPQTGSEGSLHDEVRRRGVELIVMPELVRQVAPAKDLRGVRALASLFRDLQADVVHTNSSKAGIVGRIAARRARVPHVVHTVHGWPFHDHQRSPVRFLWQELERRTAPLAERLVVVADADREKGLAAGIGRSEQYVTIRSGLEMDLYGPQFADRSCIRTEFRIPADALVVGAVNRLSAQKDPITLIDAFAAVSKQRPDTWLLVVGDGPLRAAAEARTLLHGVEHRVIFAGLRDDVPQLLRAMDVFLSTSLWEGLPRTVIAAMASSVPVVCTPAGGVVDVVRNGETGLLAPAGHADMIAAAVLRLINDSGLRARLAAAASERVRAFDARQMTRDLERLYEELVRS